MKVLRFFNFKFLMLTFRRLSKHIREFLESEEHLQAVASERSMCYKMSQGAKFAWPKKTNYKVA